MPLHEPRWWYKDPDDVSPVSLLLWPAAKLYDIAGRLRFALTKPHVSTLPVMCVGNFTAGGSGKTPVAIAVAALAEDMGYAPWFLSRGYGGTATSPVYVDPSRHNATTVGDEPLLLARHAPTVVSRDRLAGVRFIECRAPPNSLIIMDDGLQYPSLGKDVTLAVVSASRGIGNGRVIPAGPLRISTRFQSSLVDAILLTGTRQGETARESVGRRHVQQTPDLSTLPVIDVAIAAKPQDTSFRTQPLIAYAGIADPDRFFATVTEAGGNIISQHVFADHAMIDNAAAQALLDEATQKSAKLITTEKDFVRLSQESAQGDLKSRSLVLPIAAEFEGPSKTSMQDLITLAVTRRDQRLSANK